MLSHEDDVNDQNDNDQNDNDQNDNDQNDNDQNDNDHDYHDNHRLRLKRGRGTCPQTWRGEFSFKKKLCFTISNQFAFLRTISTAAIEP